MNILRCNFRRFPVTEGEKIYFRFFTRNDPIGSVVAASKIQGRQRFSDKKAGRVFTLSRSYYLIFLRRITLTTITIIATGIRIRTRYGTDERIFIAISRKAVETS